MVTANSEIFNVREDHTFSSSSYFFVICFERVIKHRFLFNIDEFLNSLMSFLSILFFNRKSKHCLKYWHKFQIFFCKNWYFYI